MSVSLSSVARALAARSLLMGRPPAEDPWLDGATQDSRTVAPGDLFVAWKGTTFDAHCFVEAAAEAGAVAAVVERRVPGAKIPQLVVRDGRLGAAIAADMVYGSPWRDVFGVGVTGTNGKTTTALLARSLLSGLGPAAAIGTLGLVEPNGTVRSGTESLTTPGPAVLAAWLRSLADGGARSVVVETSSHALEQKRVEAVRFDVAVFTNLTQDHLDYHPSFEAYRKAKAHLSELVVDDGVLVVNKDEPGWDDALAQRRRLTFSTVDDADLRARNLVIHRAGTRFRLEDTEGTVEVELPLIGRFNVENALGAAGAATVAGMALRDVAVGLSNAPQVPGRLERVVDQPFTVAIDYAHTPDALVRVLRTLRPIVSGRLIVVFGAGGDRDRSKRPKMGEAVAAYADYAVVTSDNPRTEDPDAIIAEIVTGMRGQMSHREPERGRAIAHALDYAGDGDFVLLAGKGHEAYQVLGTERIPFDERGIVLAHLGSGGRA